MKDYYELIKTYYNTFKVDGTRLWTKEMVLKAVEKGKITQEQANTIIGA